MNKETRTYKSIKNISYGVVVQLITTILRFVSRTIFIKILDAEYLGINGLFTNILSILSLAELGFGQAIIYNMYKPIADKDEKKIAALMNFYRKVYDIIAVLVFSVGILIIPCLQLIVKSELSIVDVRIYYILFLISTVISYLFSYKSAILNADQKQYKQSIYSLITFMLQFILQIVVLILTRNYVFYLVTQIIISLISNIIVSLKVNKMYPYINQKEKLEKSEKKTIYSNVLSLFIYKTSGVLLNNTDNILISMLVGTVSVGYYSNYLMIISALNAFLTTIFYSTVGSVGNLNAEKNREKQHNLYSFMNLFAGYIYGMCGLVLVFVMNDFIKLWLGEQYVLGVYTTLIIILNFYMPGMLTPSWIFRDTTGLFKKTRYLSLITASINLILSIILGVKLGVFGILLATAISRVMTNFWYEPYILYKNIFKMKTRIYWKKYLVFGLIYSISYLLTYIIIRPLTNISMVNIFIKAIVSFAITSVLFLIFFINDKNVKNILLKIKKILDKKICIIKYQHYKKYCKKNNQKEYIMFSTPLHGNIGDQAIIYAEYELFKNLGIKFFEVPTYTSQYYFEFIKKNISKDAIVCIHGRRIYWF